MNKVAAAKPCSGCGHTEFSRDFQATAGDIICQKCGMVQVENPIVSEVQFGESSSGAATVQGAMVGADQARVYNMRNSLESREQTLMSAKQRIKLLAASMRIPDYIQESAHGWFKLALVQNFVQGRRSQNVIAACLYVACRHEKTPHLLIDFSSRLQISVYSLGATYLKIVRALQIQRLPLADPSLFIQHFAERLHFKEHTAKVCRDATKIAQRMSSDWIYEGRRPAGIAGACLLLAARMNNFRRSHAEIVAVAKVGEETIQKRLNEFKKTSSASLSVSDFRSSEHTEDSQPPSFQKNRAIEAKIERLLRQRTHTLKKYKELANKRELYNHLARERPSQGDSVVNVTPVFANAVENLGSSSQAPISKSLGEEREAANVASETLAAENTKSAPESAQISEPVVSEGNPDQANGSSEATKDQEEPQVSAESAEKATKQVSDDREPSSPPRTRLRTRAQSKATVPEVKPVKEKAAKPATKTSSQTDSQAAISSTEYTNPWGYVRPDLQISAPDEEDDEESVDQTATQQAIAEQPARMTRKQKLILRLNMKKVDAKESKQSEDDGDEEVNELFVPASDDDEEIPLTHENNDLVEDPEAPSKKLSELLKYTPQSKASKASNGRNKKATTGRLGSITDSRGSSRLKTGKVNKAAELKKRKEEMEERKRREEIELKRRKEEQKAEEAEAREDKLMQAVLSGGDIGEEDLEIALDKILQGQKKSLDNALYRTPAQTQNETDLQKQIELNRPRNLVEHNLTTSQVLARVRDDEIINSDDDDEEVENVQLSADEKLQKERVWIALNHDFLIAQERKRLKLEADELTGNTSGQPRKRRKIKEADASLDDEAVADAINSIGEIGKMITPAENAKQMLQKKSFSRKINYSSIGDLFNE